MAQLTTKSIFTIGWAVLFAIILYIPSLHFIDHLPIRQWDESLFGLRALHMYKTGSYMHDFELYDGLMSHLNTKLPFTTWIQVLFIKIFGVNVFALRLPIVIVFIATILFVIRFANKHLSASSIGLIFTMILLCSPGIVRNHLLLTGDQDMPFICYLLVSTISYFQYLEYKRNRYLVVFSIALIAAFLTKSLFAGIFIPGLLLYTIYRKKLMEVIKDKFIWLSIFSILGSFSAVVFYLENAYPGFIERMWGYELMGRYTDAQDGHRGEYSFYFKELAFESFRLYFWFVPLSIIVLFSDKISKPKSNLLVCFALVYFSFLLIISFAKTKLFWYGAPLMPIGAMMIAIALQHIYEVYLSQQKSISKYGISIVFIVLFFAIPYREVIQNVKSSEVMFQREKFGLFIEKMWQDHPIHKSYTIAEKDFGTASMWYKEKYNLEKGFQLRYEDENNFSDGELVMTCLQDVGANLHDRYDYEVWHEYGGCKFIKILKEK